MIRAPFNFVPLADEVVFPEWANMISQDIPFADGLSGSIEIEITSKTPIYVRNGHKPFSLDKVLNNKDYRDTEEYKQFINSDEYKSFSNKPDGTYFIPATSIKGELRRIIEILTFSKMNHIDNKRYGIRDLQNRKYKDSMSADKIKRVKEYLGEKHKKPNFDFSECIFGSTDSEKPLKGRVQITSADCLSYRECNLIRPYLASPKPTYYPIYIDQTDNGAKGYIGDRNKFTTMLDGNAKLRGWKMYPTRLNLTVFPQTDEKQVKNTSPAIPLDKNSKFRFILRFHNLKEVELGAILFALSPDASSHHSLGMAKAYGYGVCKYDIIKTNGFGEHSIDELVGKFKNYMNQEYKGSEYMKSPQVRELKRMMNPEIANHLDRKLEYMPLEDFVKYKKHNPKKKTTGQYLPLYSELTVQNQQTPAKSNTVLAEVTFFSGAIKRAKLKEGKDRSTKTLEVQDRKIKLKAGDTIEVELIKNGKELKFIKKV